MPRVMVRPQSVTVDTVVYIADRLRGVILRYDPHTNNFTKLHYQCWGFAITELALQRGRMASFLVLLFTHSNNLCLATSFVT